MAGDLVKALCAKDKVPPEPVSNDDGENRFACPVCGVNDTAENILREAMEHAKEMTARHLQESARGIARRSKLIQFSGKPIPKGNYRFISDLKL